MARPPKGQEQWDALPPEWKAAIEEFGEFYRDTPPAQAQEYQLQALAAAIEENSGTRYLDEGAKNALITRALGWMEKSSNHQVPYLALGAAFTELRQEMAAQGHRQASGSEHLAVEEVDTPQFQKALRQAMNLRAMPDPYQKLDALVAMAPAICNAVLKVDADLRGEISGLEPSDADQQRVVHAAQNLHRAGYQERGGGASGRR